jgi:hypothetical protein
LVFGANLTAVSFWCHSPRWSEVHFAPVFMEANSPEVLNAQGLRGFSTFRTCIHNLKRPSGRAFSRLAALKNLEIHKGFL